MITPRILAARPSVFVFAVLALACIFVTGSAFHIRAIENQWMEHSVVNIDGESEAFYLKQAAKFESYGRPVLAETTLREGLKNHPTSERIANTLGIRLIKNEAFGDAEKVLRSVYDDVAFTPTDGTMENNIAWSALHHPDESVERTLRAANIATIALKKEPLSCEILHTNIVAQYALTVPEFNDGALLIADSTRTLDDLLKTYRNDARCYKRDGSWEVVTENLSVVYVRRELIVATGGHARVMTEKLQVAKAKIRDSYKGAYYGSAAVGIPQPSLKKKFKNTLRNFPSAWWDYDTNNEPFSFEIDDIDPVEKPRDNAIRCFFPSR